MRRRSAERKLMRSDLISRRDFLVHAGGAVAVSMACGRTALSQAAAQPRPMRLGGPVFVKSDDPAVLAKAHRALGYRAAYAPGQMDVNDRYRIAAWVKEFSNQDVVIAEVGAFRNILDPNPDKRRQNFEWVTE